MCPDLDLSLDPDGFPRLRLLLVEDSATDAELLIRRLQANGLTDRPRWVQTIAELRRALERIEDFDAVLSDYHLQGFTALDVLRVLREAGPDLPLIVVTGSISEEVAASCLRAGAADYLVKDRLTNLAAAIVRAIGEAQARLRERASNAALEQSETRFRLAFDDAPVGVALVSLEPGHLGEMIRVNTALTRIAGDTQDQLLGSKSWDLYQQDDRALAQFEMVELAAGRPSAPHRENRVHRADGAEVWVQVTSSPVVRDGLPWYAISHIEDITARRAAETELARRELFDPLTGLPNRHVLMDQLLLALHELDHSPGCVAVLFVDLNRFKDVNKTYGNQTGDLVLIEVGRRLTGAARPGIAARVAGNEFAVVCSGSDAAGQARSAAERITEQLRQPMDLGGIGVQLSASIGMSVSTDPHSDAERLLDQAELAMHEAKRQGLHHVGIFEPGMEHPGASRLEVESYLRSALAHGWLRLHFQPVIDLRSNAIVSAEALLRIEHPDRGLISPAEFISVAEDSDLILPIGEWVIGEACRQLAEWRSTASLNMAINVSGRQVSNLTVARQVLAAAQAHDLPLDLLSLEITERVLIDAAAHFGNDLRLLSDGGVKIAIDDFGTGYSSLTYLQRFPIDTVKIDRTFVSGLGVRSRDEAIVNAVIAMGAALDLTVVAEGVETAEQAQQLGRLGCRRVQGYLYAKPLDPADFTRLLTEPRPVHSQP